MSRYTVLWHGGAQDELAELWMNAAHPSLIQRGAREVDELLAIDPGRKGASFALSRLPAETVARLLTRISPLPEDLRFMRLGPIDVYFVFSSDDRTVTVYLLEPRGRA